MKKPIILFFILFSAIILAQVSRDANVQKAADFVKAEKWEQVLSVLQKENKDDPEVLFFVTVAEFKVLKDNENDDFMSVNKVRTYATQYLQKFGGRKADWSQTIKDIYSSLDEINPAKNVEEYLANEKQKERLRIEKLNAEKLKFLQDQLSTENYQRLKSTIHSYESENLLEPYHLDYFKSVAEYGLLKMNDNYEISDVQFVKKQLTGYLSNHGSSNSFYSESIRTALSFINENFANTEAELVMKRAELAKSKYKQKLKADFDQIKQNYINNSYTTVIQKADFYPADAEFSEEVIYYKVLSQYSVFMESDDREFNNISQLRNDLQGFISNKKFSNSLYKKEVENKLTYINTAFPKTLQEFNDQKDQAQRKLLKEREDQQRAANQAERKSNMSRRMSNGFFAIGYEGGTIAKYGIRLEKGGESTIGFFLNARTSFVNDADLLSGKVVENKNEAVAGPSIKIAPWMFINVGAGYGFYKFAARNDYASTMNLEEKDYVVGYGGVTFRLGPTINIVGGASFIDITEDFYTPEYTFGLTINLK